VPPSFDPGGTQAGIVPPDNDSLDCANEDCLVRAYRQAQRSGYPYPGLSGAIRGPNSNTFVNDLLRACGLTPIWPPGVRPYTN
jgi:hypothetical protein